MKGIFIQILTVFLLLLIPDALKAQRHAYRAGVKRLTIAPDSLRILSGQALFCSNCAMCHSVNIDLTGPKLAGVTKKRSSVWIQRFVQNSRLMLVAGDSAAIAIDSQFPSANMTSFPCMSQEQIEDIFIFIDSRTTGTSDNERRNGFNYEVDCKEWPLTSF